ncbi:hypothetical protein ABZ532_09370 [Streptomyces sp. NPDC019396]|uniref:hypothetical protein n=1 Tax=Streptomyces sp. NPDC019396 TaxID=3154687 RepID=UPI0033C8AEF7
MWPGQNNSPDPSGNPPDPAGNPYQHPPAYHQYPTAPAPVAAGQATPDGRGRSSKSTFVAVCGAAVVVLASAVTGFAVLRGGNGSPVPTASSLPAPTPTDTTRRTGDATQPVLPGWSTVANPRSGIVFDVPPEWARRAQSWVSYVAEDGDPEEKPLIGFSGTAVLKERWCSSDENVDGSEEDTALASAGSRRENGARSPEEAARDNVSQWVYGAYAQPDRSRVTTGTPQPYTTASGLTGSLATATSSGVRGKGKCGTDGKATAFAFKNTKGDIASWTFVGSKDVDEEVPDALVRKILSTVRPMTGAADGGS